MSPVHWYKGQALLKELGRREFLKGPRDIFQKLGSLRYICVGSVWRRVSTLVMVPEAMSSTNCRSFPPASSIVSFSSITVPE